MIGATQRATPWQYLRALPATAIRRSFPFLPPLALAVHLAATLVLTTPSLAFASALLPMATGAPDMSLNGANIAEPLSPSGALFANPAGLCGFDRTTVSGGFGYGFGSNEIDDDSGYSESNSLSAVLPNLAVVFAGSGRWRYGWGTHGSVGSSYDFPADADAEVANDFHAETAIAELPFAVAYRWSERLHLGAELIGLGGHLRNRYTLGDDLFRYTMRGAGVQPMLGATWKPHDRWSIGLGLRLPGYLWMDGSTAVPAGTRRDVDLRIEMPSQISLGLNHRLTERMTLYASGRWTDSSRFGDSDIEFDGMPESNVPFIPDAKDEWRYAAAVQFQPTEIWYFRFGLSHSNRIVGSKGASPLVFDNNDTRVTFGFALVLDEWTVDTTVGYSFHDHRDIDASEALVIPGRYDSGGGAVVLGLTRTL